MVLKIEREDFEKVQKLFQENPDWDTVVMNTDEAEQYDLIKIRHAVDVKVSDTANAVAI